MGPWNCLGSEIPPHGSIPCTCSPGAAASPSELMCLCSPLAASVLADVCQQRNVPGRPHPAWPSHRELHAFAMGRSQVRPLRCFGV